MRKASGFFFGFYFGYSEQTSYSPRKKTSTPNTALATIASHKARGVVSWRMREMPRVQRTNKLRTTQTHAMWDVLTQCDVENMATSLSISGRPARAIGFDEGVAAR
jgi:hypothetical protein